jgi:anti-sigma factor ChrR (cupin superfamily)
MMDDTLTRDETELLDGIVAESIEPIAPPPALRRRILDAIVTIPQNSRTVRRDEGRWAPLPFPGVKVKTLSVDDERGTATILMMFDPGARLPAHDHHGDEQSFVVSGSCRIGAVHLRQGDFHRAGAGSHHGDVVSDEGCVLLLLVDAEDYRAA